jgi:hypothetical protein
LLFALSFFLSIPSSFRLQIPSLSTVWGFSFSFLGKFKEETALLYDLASHEKRAVPHDIADTFIYEEVGELARCALRLSKECTEPEEEWKQLIRLLEANKAKGVKISKEGSDEG